MPHEKPACLPPVPNGPARARDVVELMDHRESRKTAAEGARRGRRGDLTALAIPMIAINGSFDAPYAKTHRFWREAHVFENIILSEKTHLTAIAVGDPCRRSMPTR